MSDDLKGTPAELTEKVASRYEPLRDSRAHSEPEQNQRKVYRSVAYLLLILGVGVDVALIATGKIALLRMLFGVAVAGLGVIFWRLAKSPLKFAPPEPLENLAALSQALGLCRMMEKIFPEMTFELDPIAGSLQGSCDGYVWSVKIRREALKPAAKSDEGYDSYTIIDNAKGATAGSSRVWQRSSHGVHRHRIVWVVTVEGSFQPRPGQPTEDTCLESCEENRQNNTECVFALPINQPKQPGLGHQGRTDFISSPLGLHHPEFVGEQIARSLAWMFKPNIRL